MSLEAVARLSARLPSQYLNGGHVTYWVADLNDIASIATMVSALGTDTHNLYVLTANIYTQALAVSGGQLGTGAEQLKVPLNVQLGSAAYLHAHQLRGYMPNLQNGAYTILPQDMQKFSYCTSGTNTWTLLDAADYPDEWCCPIMNTTGVNLTIARTNSGNTINGSAASLTVATGATTRWIFKVSNTAFMIG